MLLPLLFWGSLLSARADDHIRAVRLSNVVGSVQVLSGTETQFSQAYPNMPLMEGSTLKTGEDGRAEIQFEDGSVARVTPNSSMALSVLSRSADGKLNTALDLLTGLTYVELKATPEQRIAVHFDGNEVVSQAPAKFRVNLDANPVEFAVLDGTAHLSKGTDYSLDVHANETVRFDATGASRYYLAQGVDGNSWDQWNTDRDQASGAMASMETREARGNAGSNNPGWSDLDYYGNWYSSPNGSVWAPTGAGAGWDPYGSGYWGYYGNAGGYSWISGYPWGWLPYQCGAWNYYNAFGWGWSPGGCGYPGYGFGSGILIGAAPPRYRRLPHPNPVHRVGGVVASHQRLIAVDRGPEATKLDTHIGAAPKVVELNGKPAQLLAKSANPSNTLVGRAPTMGRQGSTFAGGTERGFGTSVGFGERPGSNVPAFRPSAPSSEVRATAPSAGFHASAPASNGARSGGVMSAPSYSAASSASAASHMGGSSGGGGGGGGHVK